MIDLENLPEQLHALDQAASKGVWGQFSPCQGPFQSEANKAFRAKQFNKIDTSHHVSSVRDGEPYRVAEFRHSDDAAFAEMLVNAYRAGFLVLKTQETQG